jgi:hypothetical protein
MLISTEDQEPFSRVSKFLIGPLLNKDMDGNLILIQEPLGMLL